MTVIDYENIEEVTLDIASQSVGSNTSSVPWVNSPSIDATTQVINIPTPTIPPTTPDIVWRSTDIVRTSSDYNTISRSSWSIKLWDWTTYNINAGNTWNMTAITYVYADIATPSATLLTTTTPEIAVWIGKIMVAVCKLVTDTAGKAIVQPFWTIGTDVFITADNIAANTITANKMNINTLSALSANLWTITAGTITWATIRTAATGQRVQLDSSFLTLYDASNNFCWTIYWDTFNFSSLWNKQTTIIWWADVTYISSNAWTIINSPYLYTWLLRPVPWLSNIDIWETGTPYRYLALESWWRIYLWDNYLYKTNSTPRRFNWSSSYYIPILTWASTNKTTNASIKINFWWTEYYINVLAA